MSENTLSNANPHRYEIVKKLSDLLAKELFANPNTQASKVYATQVAVEIYDELFGPIPEYDNHHNALLCPYCNRRRDGEEKEIRAQAFEDAAVEMDRLVMLMRKQQERVLREGQSDWPASYLADREAHAIWLRKWAEKERES